MAIFLEFGKEGCEAAVAVHVFLLGRISLAGGEDFIEVGIAIVSGVYHARGGRSFDDVASFGSICDNLRHKAEEVDDGILLCRFERDFITD